jgi:four helix bundle protein
MYDFQKLEVYQFSKTFHKDIRTLLREIPTVKYLKDQLLRASMSVMLNIAEGTGRFSKPDKRNFYIIARSSIFECVALLEILKEDMLLADEKYSIFSNSSERISKILFVLIYRLSN